MKQLTKAEEQIMQALWETGPAFVKDLIEVLPEPKPHYNTVSTLIKILVEKGFVDFKAYGKSHQYFPLISKDDYSRKTVNTLVNGYFHGSFSNLVSFFVKEKEVSISELEELIKKIKDNEKK
ncbi:Predicted transcriptional regulator [Chitinophaga terrae (ex Kim and Jung 2007)]|jgi:predicted transcriptional regulator|uniref:Predicted transcriptional regulator n=1 Tax=Chitinophaga terrae (ex Kim and Jung 2007) TaxID=408074 RepID=A0A1H4C1I1_9BACT|nr:BlaI/MecI/CopY family transcriptional regulator [Chitinophaga terrae (ex Kim and Jung 2007)]MDQ0108555.1 putative transcriptional regulator [Chitinophaga terrae (ex Kim and Jung 2007)]GEP91975.1 transcriptional regulator [Chitinophaga terrae (ex Kim and Jung 2007)]SEA54190.1 Predicted transcriptional regulator [Chitinophaga terrae (ex Kim and Jung 2007)]